MQKLHLIGFTADNDGLIFSTRKGAKSGSFVVPIDVRLLKQVAEAERMRDGGGAAKAEEHRLSSPRLVRPESALTPREMQDRIRSGWTLDEVATEAGVDDDWVRRFAAPVLAEVRQVVERARAAVYDKPRYGLSTLPLGASVRRNVFERGVRIVEEELDDAWTAFQLDDGIWIVRFAYTSRGRLQEAEWLYELETEELASRNRLASQLGHVDRGGARRAAAKVSTVPKPTKKVPATKAAVTGPALTKAAPAVKLTAKKAAATKLTAKKVTPKKAAVKKAAVKKAATKRLGTKKAAAKQPAVKKAAAKLATKKASAKKRAAKKPSAKKPSAEKLAVRKAPARRMAAKAPVKRKKAAAPVKKAARAPLRPAAVQRATPSRPPARSAATDGAARPASTRRKRAVPRKKAASQPAKKPAKERAPARAAVEVLPAVAPSAWTPPAPARRLPPPAPGPEPAAVRQAVASPIGDELDPPRPGATDVDPVSGIARIDSRRTSHYVSGPTPRQPVFRGDVSRADGQPAEPPGPRRPRRSEPLRGR